MARFYSLAIVVFYCFAIWITPACSGFQKDRDPKNRRLIVFVHGWGGLAQDQEHERSTWTSPETGAYWPKLVQDDPEMGPVDVFVYSYTSGCSRDALSIADLADELRKTLHKAPETGGAGIQDYRDVIFVAHSIGGLIVREYISIGRPAPGQTARLFLFASPAGGTDRANWVIACGGSVVEELSSARAVTSYLTQLNDRWVTSRPSIDVNSWCVTANDDGVVNDPLSARLLCNRSIRSLAAGHRSIVKPNGVNHPSHELLRSWMRDAFEELHDVVKETRADIVFANCSESYYSSILQTVMMDITARRNLRIRLTPLLPIRFSEFELKKLWRTTNPSIVVIHLSCFQQRWKETAKNAEQRTKDFVSLLHGLETSGIKIIVYSKAFEGSGLPRFFPSVDPTGIADRLRRQSKLFFVQIGGSSSRDATPEQQFVKTNGASFVRQLTNALNPDFTPPPR